MTMSTSQHFCASPCSSMLRLTKVTTSSSVNTSNKPSHASSRNWSVSRRVVAWREKDVENGNKLLNSFQVRREKNRSDRNSTEDVCGQSCGRGRVESNQGMT
jgi:hypothetical protein